MMYLARPKIEGSNLLPLSTIYNIRFTPNRLSSDLLMDRGQFSYMRCYGCQWAEQCQADMKNILAEQSLQSQCNELLLLTMCLFIVCKYTKGQDSVWNENEKKLIPANTVWPAPCIVLGSRHVHHLSKYLLNALSPDYFRSRTDVVCSWKALQWECIVVLIKHPM